MNAVKRGLDRVDNFLGRIENPHCCVLIVVMSLVIFLQIICRFLKVPLVWSEELGRFMFIWLIYISVCLSTRRESHLCCDILPIIVRGEIGRNVIKIVSNLLCLCFFAFVVYYGIGVIEKLIARPQTSAAMHLNMIWAYAGPYVGAAIASIRYVMLIIKEIIEIVEIRQNEEGLNA